MKKTLTLMVCLALILTLIPGSSLAEGGYPFPEGSAAFYTIVAGPYGEPYAVATMRADDVAEVFRNAWVGAEIVRAPYDPNAKPARALGHDEGQNLAVAGVSINNLSHTPTRTGDYVYPNIEAEIDGQAVVHCQVTLYKQVYGRWEEVDCDYDTRCVNARYQFNPGSYVQAGYSYQYVVRVEMSGQGSDGAVLSGSPFVVR